MKPPLALGDLTVTISPLPAMRAFALQPRLAPALAEVGAAIGALAGGDLAAVDVAALAPMVGRFFMQLPPHELEAITRTLLETAMVSFADASGKTISTQLLPIFDAKMQGRTLDVWKILWHALEVNFPDFFALLAAKSTPPPAASPSAV